VRVAIIHDWLLGMRGGERCLEEFLRLYPEADIYTAFLDREKLSPMLKEREIETSILNSLPNSKKYHRYLLPLYPLAAKSLSKKLKANHENKKYDLVFSISHCLAKNVSVPKDAFHVCYCLTPMRYLWDQYNAYFDSSKIEPLARIVVKQLRKWDVAGVSNVDAFVSISNFVASRLKKVYGRESTVIYPPVRSDWIASRKPGEKGQSFLCASALVPYKNIDQIIRAFNFLPNEKLLVVGDGQERSGVERLSTKGNVGFLGRVSDEKLAELYKDSKALIFAAEEDFGMIPVEMQAAGRPVICLSRGGALETVKNTSKFKTGIYFDSPEPKAIAEAVEQFSVSEEEFTVDNCLKHAELFSQFNFRDDLLKLLESNGLGKLQKRVNKK